MIHAILSVGLGRGAHNMSSFLSHANQKRVSAFILTYMTVRVSTLGFKVESLSTLDKQIRTKTKDTPNTPKHKVR